ncbi:phage holin family protein [Cytobacillus sp. FJAT-54145]|uniref:Phage holin family protein n=1 Tax=Cytobacillus spartinae TaxID=3299023 RepID=A0ABW6K7F7_9BACI
MDFLIQFLNKNYYMLVPALWVLGYALKQTPKIPDWSIIWILLVCSLGFGTFAFGFSFKGALNGIIAAGIAVLGHQMVKQTLGARTEKKEIIIKKEESKSNKK